MKINHINTNTLEIECDYRNRSINSRIVYFDPKTQKYIKIWDNNYFYKKYFENIYRTKKEYFADISLLEDIIEDDNGNILGYITPKAQPMNFAIVDKQKYNDLVNRLTKNSKNFGVFYLDLNLPNIVELNNIYYIIDLEPSIPISHLHELQNINNLIQYNNYYYVNNVRDLLSNVVNINPKFRIVKQHTYHRKDIKYGTANGRIFLEKEYLPKLKGKTLFVGVNYYNDFYHRLVQNEELFETLDVMEERMEDGSPHKHYICNILDFENQGYYYDDVCFFGIIGHYDDWDIIKNKEDVIKCITILDAQVAIGGTLLLGPAANLHFNTDWWDEIYSLPLFKKYTTLMLKKIDINYIWHGVKNG